MVATIEIQLKGEGEGSPGGCIGPVPEQSSHAKARRWLLCRHCGARVARPGDAIVVDGSHEHRFLNPAGYVFRIRCFAEASRLERQGPASLEWSWFDGYAWQITTCAGCGAHLGWIYQAREGTVHFYGLVATELSWSGDQDG